MVEKACDRNSAIGKGLSPQGLWRGVEGIFGEGEMKKKKKKKRRLGDLEGPGKKSRGQGYRRGSSLDGDVGHQKGRRPVKTNTGGGGILNQGGKKLNCFFVEKRPRKGPLRGKNLGGRNKRSRQKTLSTKRGTSN